MSLDLYWNLLVNEGERNYLGESGCIELIYDIYYSREGIIPPARVVLYNDENMETAIPEEFKDVKGGVVKEIQFAGNIGHYEALLTFPFYLTEFVNLVKLDLRNYIIIFEDNKVNNCPLFKLKSLQFLRLTNCRLKHIPKEISNLKNLKILRLSFNLIQELPDELFDLTSLIGLYLGGNKLSNLSEQINNLIQLERLWLHGNNLSSFPEIKSNDMKLVELDLSNNKIKTLPKSITQLKSLAELYIQENNILAIPENIGEFKNLNKFNCSNNLLTYLPESITILNLEEFDVSPCPLQKPPLETCEKGIDAIKGYFTALRKFNGYHTKRCKVILIGESMAGKTSLCQGLINAKEGRIDSDTRTEGIDLFKWKVRPEVDDLEALIVDCAGQRKYMISHSFFMSQGCLFLLVLDLYNYNSTIDCYRKNVGHWMSVIFAHVPDATVLIVPTHLDLFEKEDQDIIHDRCKHILDNVWKDVRKRKKDFQTSRLDESNDSDVTNPSARRLDSFLHSGTRYISSVLLLENESICFSDACTIDSIKMIPISSFKELKGMAELKEEIMKVLSNRNMMPLVGREIPAVYPKLEEYCVNQRKHTPVMKLDQFVEKAEKRFEMNREMILSALQYFDTTGSVLYFNSVNQIVFLDPEWFINVLKKVFNHNIEQNLIYNTTFLDSYHLTSDDFMQLKSELLDNAQLSSTLLRCIWSDFVYITKSDEIFFFLIDILCYFNLAINFGNQDDFTDSSSITLLVPWFFKPATEHVISKHWPKDKQDTMLEVVCQFDSIVSSFPIGSFEHFVSIIHDLFHHSITYQNVFFGIQENCKICCSIVSVGDYGKLILKGRCEKDNLDDMWKTILPVLKIADDFLKRFPGLGCIKLRSLCPSCLTNLIDDPYVFNIPCWFTYTVKKDFIACKKEHILIPIAHILPPKDVINEFHLANGIENNTLSTISNDRVHFDSLILDEISQRIGPTPTSLGRCLNLPFHKVQNICYDKRFEQVTEQNIALFYAWIEQLGCRATIYELYKCILSMRPKRHDILEYIIKYQPK